MSSTINLNVSSYASNTVNSIFKSLGTNQSSGMTSLLGDYYAIKNGSYYRMARMYYAKQGSDTTSSSDSVTERLAASDSKSSTTTAAMKAANTAVDSVSKLLDDDLYQKTVKTGSDGNQVEDYDRDAILKNLKTFVSDYNSLVKSASSSGRSATVQAGESVIAQTASFSSSLSRIGISIGEDDMLSLDEDKFAGADIADVQSLFTGSSSYGKNIQMKMLQVYSTEVIGQNMSNGIYSSQSTDIWSVGNMFDSLF